MPFDISSRVARLLRVIKQNLINGNLIISSPSIRRLLRSLTLNQPQTSTLRLHSLVKGITNLALNTTGLRCASFIEVTEHSELSRIVRRSKSLHVPFNAERLLINRFRCLRANRVIGRQNAARRINTSFKLSNSRSVRVSGLSGQDGELSLAVSK